VTTTASTVLQVLIVVAILGLIISKRLKPRPVKEDTRRWRLPLILMAIGVYGVIGTTHGTDGVALSGKDVGYLVIGAVLSLALGAVRGVTIKLTGSTLGLMQQYTYKTVALWVLIILVRLGMDVAGKSAGVASAVIGSSILLMFGLSLLGESVAVAARVGGQLDRAV
jgi:hypothetical protein